MFLPWTWKMVRRSSPPSLFFSLSVSADPPLFSPLMSTSRLSSCHVFCYHQRDKWETREEESLGARVLTSSPPPPSLHLIFYPPSFCLPEWQLAASRVQWACQPKCRYLPTDLRKYTFWTWLTHACVSYRCSFFFFFFLSFSGRLVQTCNTHYTPRCPRSFVAIKTCNSTSFTDGLEMDPVGPARRQRPRVKEKKKSSSTKRRNWSGRKQFHVDWFYIHSDSLILKNHLPIRECFMMKMFVFAGPGKAHCDYSVYSNN